MVVEEGKEGERSGHPIEEAKDQIVKDQTEDEGS